MPKCVICGSEIERKPSDTTGYYNRLKTCRAKPGERYSACYLAQTKRSEKHPAPKCKTCGRDIPRLPREKCSKWKDQRYCRGETAEECRRGLRKKTHTPSGPKLCRGLPRKDVSPDLPAFTRYEPKPKKLFLTNAEQSAIDRAVNIREAERMGLTFDPGRSLSREEIDLLWNAGEITPIEQVRVAACRKEALYPGLADTLAGG